MEIQIILGDSTKKETKAQSTADTAKVIHSVEKVIYNLKNYIFLNEPRTNM